MSNIPNQQWGQQPMSQNQQDKPQDNVQQNNQNQFNPQSAYPPQNMYNPYMQAQFMPQQFQPPQQNYGQMMPQGQADQGGQQQKGQPNAQQPTPGSMGFPMGGGTQYGYPGMPNFPMPMTMPNMGMGAYGQTYPMAFPAMPPMPFQMPASSIIADSAKLQEKDKTIGRLNDEIISLKTQIDDQKYEFDKSKKKIEQKALEDTDELNGEIIELRNKINELENRISQLLKQNQVSQQQFVKEKEEYVKQISDLEQNLDDARWQVQNLESQKSQSKNQNPMIVSANTNTDYSDKLKRELEQAKRQITILDKQITELKNNSKNQIDTQIFDLQQELDKNEIARQEFIRENENLRRQLQKLKQENIISNESVYTLQNQLRESDNKFKQQKKINEDLSNNIQARDQQIQELEQIFRKQQEQPLGRPDAVDIQKELMNQYNQLQAKKQNQQEFERQQAEKQKQEMILEQQKREDKLKDKIQFDIQEKERKRNQAKLIQQRMVQSHGQMDVCFLVDVTASMDPYKEQTKQCINGSMAEIKKLTNRDTSFACVCYQDIAEYRKNTQGYQQFDFTKNPASLENWLQQVKCGGGGDIPEDIRGGMIQMCNNLKWSNRFKIAILICDAPCHGQKYHEANMKDDYPMDDIADAINLMIKQEILFIGLNFKPFTTKMYQLIKQMFVDQKKEELFMLVDMQNTPLLQVAQQMVKQIGQASQSATQTNNNSTRSKQQAQDQKQAKDGAMEALCKQGNFMNFETQVKTVDVKFTVLRTEIKADSLERNLKTIQNIQTPQDYQNIQEGFWDCIRTESPFAYGMMKAVFLMKKKPNLKDELYVIKTPLSGRPYRTLDEALKECKSHLICQQLMKKFFRDLNEQLQKKKILKKFKEVVYSDFLILQENETSFWIAERFFKGEFVKYNNNFGFISESEDELNRIAQAFTYYTYFISDFNYMINDVQGVGIYFTDPAVNTKTGDFDDTDMGENGQAMFIANFSEQKQKLCAEILQILDIIDNDQGIKPFQPNPIPPHFVPGAIKK